MAETPVPEQVIAEDWLTVDRDFRILDAHTSNRLVEAHVGYVLWDAFPGTREAHGDLYGRAWDEGHAEGMGFHHGRLFHLHADRDGARMTVRYRVVAEVDVLTISSLTRSLARVLEIAAGHGSLVPEQEILRLVPQDA